MNRRDGRASLVSFSALIFASLILAPGPASASPCPNVGPDGLTGDRIYSPYVGRAYPDKVLFGDTHFHTNLSFDAGLIGTTLDVDAGFRFVRGEKVTSNAGQPVGNTVDLDTATYTNTIGDAMMAAHWTDPDFDPEEPTFYYERVLEIPTPRWTTYYAVFFGIARPDNVPATIQDRAYTSPIWFTP